MNVKKYRAQTTREALEMIKEELGANAYVLETRKIKAGGFLGLRSRNEVEISAAVPETLSLSAADRNEPGIQIVDDSEAIPRQMPTVDSASRERILNALAVRAASAKSAGRAALDFRKEDVSPKTFERNSFVPEKRPIETVELSSEAPRIVHPRMPKVRAASASANSPALDASTATPMPAPRSNILAETLSTESGAFSSVASPAVVTAPPEITRTDIELIRAELREVKFSLNSFGGTFPKFAQEFNFERDGAIFDYPFYDTYLELSRTGLDPAKIRKQLSEFVPQFSGGALPATNLSRLVLKRILASGPAFYGDPLRKHRIMAIIGATGVGKTTTIAKLAARETLDNAKAVELVTLDTYRIAAVDQLKTYAEIIGAGCHVVRNVAELDQKLNEISKNATILIDTTGRSPYDLSDQSEVSNYLKANEEIHKCLAVQSTLNHDDAMQSLSKFSMYGVNSLVLTKMDETSKPGKILDTISTAGLPMSYFCMGQRVPEDIRVADAETVSEQVLPRENQTQMRLSA